MRPASAPPKRVSILMLSRENHAGAGLQLFRTLQPSQAPILTSLEPFSTARAPSARKRKGLVWGLETTLTILEGLQELNGSRLLPVPQEPFSTAFERIRDGSHDVAPARFCSIRRRRYLTGRVRFFCLKIGCNELQASASGIPNFGSRLLPVVNSLMLLVARRR